MFLFFSDFVPLLKFPILKCTRHHIFSNWINIKVETILCD